MVASARPSSPDSHPTASDFMGSQATILVSLQPQRLHSKARRSKPSGPASTSAVVIGARHRGQRGPRAGNSSGSGFMSRPIFWFGPGNLGWTSEISRPKDIHKLARRLVLLRLGFTEQTSEHPAQSGLAFPSSIHAQPRSAPQLPRDFVPTSLL